jgi:glycine/D-amino acid oxidase-like deaminating enzyme
MGSLDAYYRSRSLWLDGVPGSLEPRPSLPGDVEVDVAVIGAGYTGLWTAYYLALADPGLNIAVLEREIAGYGASGRNGGWCSWAFAASYEKMAAHGGRDAAVAMQREMFRTVDEIGAVAAAEGIEAGFHKGGAFTSASIPAHVASLKAEAEWYGSWGFGDEFRWLEKPEADARIRVHGGLGALYTPECAAVDPARLARGLADTVERRGVTIYERTPVISFEKGRVQTRCGHVRTGAVVLATEGYTAGAPGHHRDVLPMYSLMIATEPLADEVWDEIGWQGREAFNDGRHLIIYATRTLDGRIAFGGRGAPYHWASAISDDFERETNVFVALRRSLVELFPVLRQARITHTWGGPIGIPRDWYTGVSYDRASGLGWAGGYVGDGVATANLAGRTLADLILGRDTDVTHLPWVQHRSKLWEPEPLRWLACNLSVQMLAGADTAERGSGRPSRRADAVMRLIGR